MGPLGGVAERLGVEPHSQLQVMVLLSSFQKSSESSCLDTSKKCPSWDMGLQTQLRGVKIVSTMRVFIIGLNRVFTWLSFLLINSHKYGDVTIFYICTCDRW